MKSLHGKEGKDPNARQIYGGVKDKVANIYTMEKAKERHRKRAGSPRDGSKNMK